MDELFEALAWLCDTCNLHKMINGKPCEWLGPCWRIKKISEVLERNSSKQLQESVLYEDEHHLVKVYICPNCGTKHTNKLKKFCDECGQRLER